MAEKKLSAQDFIALANVLIGIAGNISAQVAKLKLLAAQAGASNAELDDIDVRLTAAIEYRREQQDAVVKE